VNWRELAFVLKAASLGFGVAKPHGGNERYDFVVDSGERLWRVQVKSTYCAFRRGYQAPARGGNKEPYKAEEIDFVVAYIVPRDIWYVIPVNCVTSSSSLTFYPSGCSRGGYFESYREAWHLMTGRASAAGPSIRPIRR
jgi:PD-(D/E)XK endonuclease